MQQTIYQGQVRSACHRVAHPRACLEGRAIHWASNRLSAHARQSALVRSVNALSLSQVNNLILISMHAQGYE